MNAQIQSRRNGLIISLPRDATSMLGRFATKGDNELIFEEVKKSTAKVSKARKAEIEKPVTIESEAPETFV